MRSFSSALFAIGVAAATARNVCDLNTLADVRNATSVSCRGAWDECSDDPACGKCLERFTPAFDVESLAGCDEFREAFFASCDVGCDPAGKAISDLETCIADEVFYLITLGAVHNMCRVQIVDDE